MKKKILMDVIGILLIALVVVVGYKLSPLLLPRADVVIQPDPACDLQRQACAVTLPAGGSAELAMTPRPIPMAMPFEVQVTTGGFVATRVEVDFARHSYVRDVARARREIRDELAVAEARHRFGGGARGGYIAQSGRTSIEPWLAPGQRAAHDSAASRSGTSIM